MKPPGSLAFLIIPFLAVSCANLPRPSATGSSPSDPQAAAIMEKSAAAHGDPWKKNRRIDVSFTGTWSPLATKVQPTLTDPGFRKSSTETYRTGRRDVSQTHTGPQGTKTVLRRGSSVSVTYNGTPSTDPEKLDAAALVTDAYTVFLFGSSWLAENGKNLHLLPARSIDGQPCHLVAGTLTPGIGNSPSDNFIAWISKDTGHLRRFQFSLNGLESTQGADVAVTFSGFKTAPNGTVWPTRFVERVQRPLNIKAHEWHTTSLSLDGRPGIPPSNR